MCKKLLLASFIFLAFFCISIQSQEPAPELPVVKWNSGDFSLEDFKGQTTALVFFDDSFS